ncbi:MAG TPA: TIGR01212 family radical SAM protein [Phycisphaerae bacterium]|nr:TIGR01212 family radical SAM protein [Phycisphaerae bacterium]HRR85103.1 TIGR01212 family radical SAM protein [Phycisphaerae bacterium]
MTDSPRYYPFSRYLRRRYGCRVHKVTIHAGFTCPNRDGTRGYGGCTFCNNAGFSPNARTDPAVVREQLQWGIEQTRRRSRATKFIAYFQAYTNTYAPLEHLRELYDEAWKFPEIVGLSIGTRPDCVDPAKIDLIAGYSGRGEVWLEYGLQSAHDATLKAINRGHGYQEFLDAVEMTRDRGIKICVHTVLGLPGETREMILDTHRRLAQLPIDGIKIHLLHVMRDTVMAAQYARGELALLGRQEYVDLVCDVLETLPATMVIQRMHADAPRDILVAPEWCLDKAAVLEDIKRALARRDTWQGKALGFALSDIPTLPPAPAMYHHRSGV